MFYDPLQEETFAPKINKASKSLAGNLAPLAERQLSEQSRKHQRLADLAETYKAEEQKEETFAPKINANLPPGMLAGGRVPLAERDNHRIPAELPPDPNVTHKPAINPSSAALCSDETRNHLEESREVRKRVRELWAEHAMDASSMSASGVASVLLELGIDVKQNEAMRLKFHAALGLQVDNPGSRYVQYDRFVKVFTSILQKAVAAKGSTGGATASSSTAAAPNNEAHHQYYSRQQPHADERHNFHNDHEHREVRNQQRTNSVKPQSAPKRSASSARQSSSAPRRSGSAAAATTRLSSVIKSATATNVQQRPQQLHQKKLKVIEPMVPTNTQLHRQRLEREAALQKAKREQARSDFVSREEQELEECTFAPQTNPTTGLASGHPPTLVNAPGFESTVKRLANAREKAVPAFEDSLRGRRSSAKPPSTVNYRDHHGHTTVKPFRSHLEARQRQKPLLYVDVDMPNGKVGRIGVYSGDLAEELSRNFCATYGLDPSMEGKLTMLLEDRIRRAQEGVVGVPEWR